MKRPPRKNTVNKEVQPKPISKVKKKVNKSKVKPYDITNKSKLESKFEKVLISIGLVIDKDYIFQYKLGTAYYDFYIIKKNLLIEIDGDFHHCNPDTKHAKAVYSIQRESVKNDIRKNKLAKDNGYKLIRIWESQIHNNLYEVVESLKQIIL